MKRQTILVVDDNADFLESVSTVFWDAGYAVSTAQNSSQALEMAARNRPDLCVVDVAMPGADGIQLIKFFRSRHIYRQIPMILLTAGMRRDSLAEALDLGVKDVFLKSKFTAEDLVERVALRLAEPREIIRSPDLVDRPSAFRELGPKETSQIPPILPSEFLPNETTSMMAVVSAPTSTFPTAVHTVPAPVRPQSDNPSSKPPTSQMPVVGRQEVVGRRSVSKELADAIVKMQVLPKVRTDMLQTASQAQSSLAGIEGVARNDPVMALRLISATNAAVYARPTPLFDLGEAIRVLGLEQVSRIVSSSAAYKPEDRDEQVTADLYSVWRHCVATAYYAERLSPIGEKDIAFLAGLLHDLPILFALQYLGDEWLPIRAHCQVKGMSLREGLSTATGYQMNDIGSQILSTFRIPPELGGPLLRYQEHFLSNRNREPGSFARRLDIAHNLAVAQGRPGTIHAEVRSLSREELAFPEALNILAPSDGARLKYLEDQAGLGSDGTAEYPKLRHPIALWRDPRWSEPDPVESVLSMMGECVVVSDPSQLVMKGACRLAIAEPGTEAWTEIIHLAPVVVLYSTQLPDDPLPQGVEAYRMPVAVSLLAKRLRPA